MLFDHPDYWESINSIVHGTLYLTYINENNELKAWIPIVVSESEGIKIANSLTCFVSHSGPYGPDQDRYA